MYQTYIFLNAWNFYLTVLFSKLSNQLHVNPGGGGGVLTYMSYMDMSYMGRSRGLAPPPF